MNKLFKDYFIPNIPRLLLSLIFTKFFFTNCKLIRLPIFIRGRRFIKFGDSFVTGYGCRIEALGDGNPIINIGKNTQINDYCHIAAVEKISIGNNVMMGSKVFITDHDHGQFNKASIRIAVSERKLISKAIHIGDNVWIGENVVILKGVTIGNNSIIGASAVVTKDIARNSLVVGNPAKVVKILQ